MFFRRQEMPADARKACLAIHLQPSATPVNSPIGRFVKPNKTIGRAQQAGPLPLQRHRATVCVSLLASGLERVQVSDAARLGPAVIRSCWKKEGKGGGSGQKEEKIKIKNKKHSSTCMEQSTLQVLKHRGPVAIVFSPH